MYRSMYITRRSSFSASSPTGSGGGASVGRLGSSSKRDPNTLAEEAYVAATYTLVATTAFLKLDVSLHLFHHQGRKRHQTQRLLLGILQLGRSVDSSFSCFFDHCSVWRSRQRRGYRSKKVWWFHSYFGLFLGSQEYL